MSTKQPPAHVRLLPAANPESLEDPSVLNIPIGAKVPLGNLGPMVVNSDGVVSMIILLMV